MGRTDLIKGVNELRYNPKIKAKVDEKLKEFSFFHDKPELWFSELCFCILTANSTAEQCIRVHKEIGQQFLTLPLEDLKRRMRQASCRFYNTRAKYIVEARGKFDAVLVKDLADKDPKRARAWLAENIPGIGVKEASHFLRNVGYSIAIADFHIIDLLKRYRFLPAGIVLNWKNYIVIEQKLVEIAKMFKMSLGELDLYLWYLETGKILK